MSSAGSNESRAGGISGVTLIELVVVLFILATVSMALPAVFPQLWPAGRLNQSVAQLTATMKMARSRAVAFQRPTDVILQPHTRHYYMSPGGGAARLEAGVDVHTPDRSLQPLKVRFFPDGSSSGGHVVLAYDDHYASLHINPLTGRVSIGGR